MIMKCKTCELEFVPPRKNILNCSKWNVFIKAKNKPERLIKVASSESEQDDDEESESDEQNFDENSHLNQINFHAVKWNVEV